MVEMASEAIATVVEMMELLLEPAQNQVLAHLRSYRLEIQDELRWDALFNKIQPKLIEMVRLAKKQITEGKAQRLDFNEP